MPYTYSIIGHGRCVIINQNPYTFLTDSLYTTYTREKQNSARNLKRHARTDIRSPSIFFSLFNQTTSIGCESSRSISYLLFRCLSGYQLDIQSDSNLRRATYNDIYKVHSIFRCTHISTRSFLFVHGFVPTKLKTIDQR